MVGSTAESFEVATKGFRIRTGRWTVRLAGSSELWWVLPGTKGLRIVTGEGATGAGFGVRYPGG